MNPSLTDVENVHAWLYLCMQPATRIGYGVTPSTDILMEGNDNFVLQELHQVRLVVGEYVHIGYFKDSADEHSGCRLLK